MENKITTKHEHLSAFLDDEAGAFEQRRLLDELQSDEELLTKVSNYSLIGEAMRAGKHEVTVRSDFLAAIHDGIADEPSFDQVLVSEEKGLADAGRPVWLRPVTGMALAASLAAIAVVGMNVDHLQPSSAKEDAVAEQQYDQPDTAGAQALLASNDVETVPVYFNHDEAWRKRLKRYVDNHAKYASTSAIMPSVRAVSYASSF